MDVREALREFIGETLLEITSADEEELTGGTNYVMLMFSRGLILKFDMPTTEIIVESGGEA